MADTESSVAVLAGTLTAAPIMVVVPLAGGIGGGYFMLVTPPGGPVGFPIWLRAALALFTAVAGCAVAWANLTLARNALGEALSEVSDE